MGILSKFTAGETIDQHLKDGYDKSGVANLVSWDDLNKNTYFMVPTDPAWDDSGPTGKFPLNFSQFNANPKDPKNGLNTPSGLVEFTSGAGYTGPMPPPDVQHGGLLQHFPDDKERPPCPQWVVGGPGFTHDESLLGERAKKYTLLCESNHPRYRVHVNLDDEAWQREIPSCKVRGPDGYQYEPVWMNPIDANKRGIKDGDIVNIYNERGSVLAGAMVTERAIPSAVWIDHGARTDPIVQAGPGVLGIDRGGSVNLICPLHGASKYAEGGEATSGYLVEIEKADMAGLMAKYPDAFKRPFDPAIGQTRDPYVTPGS